MILPASVRVWLATEPVDMRRGHDGLLALVRSLGIADPYSGHLFVFLGRRADRCKILFWDRGGFVVAYKRLERGRFRLPAIPPDAQSIALDAPLCQEEMSHDRGARRAWVEGSEGGDESMLILCPTTIRPSSGPSSSAN